MRKKLLSHAAPLVLLAALAAAPALAAETGGSSGTATNQNAGASQNNSGHKAEVQDLVKEATDQVQTMNQNAQLKNLLAKAKGVYLVPEFGGGALVVGGRGGAGLVLAKNNGKWSDPAFYDFGAATLGPQAGGSGGKIAFLLMTDKAVNAFKGGNQVSLNADAGLTIVNFSHDSQASWGKSDIIVWTDTSGAYAGASVSISDLAFAQNNNQAFYGRKVQPDQILAGDVNTSGASGLKQALSG